MLIKIKYLSILLPIFVCLGLQLHAQPNVSYHFNNDIGSKVGVGYAFNKVFTVNAYIYGVDEFENISPEFVLRANIINKDLYKAYIGTGVATNLLYSVVCPVGVEVLPFSSQPNLSLKFEANVMFGLDGNPNRILPMLGICYNLGKN